MKSPTPNVGKSDSKNGKEIYSSHLPRPRSIPPASLLINKCPRRPHSQMTTSMPPAAYLSHSCQLSHSCSVQPLNNELRLELTNYVIRPMAQLSSTSPPAAFTVSQDASLRTPHPTPLSARHLQLLFLHRLLFSKLFIPRLLLVLHHLVLRVPRNKTDTPNTLPPLYLQRFYRHNTCCISFCFSSCFSSNSSFRCSPYCTSPSAPALFSQ